MDEMIQRKSLIYLYDERLLDVVIIFGPSKVKVKVVGKLQISDNRGVDQYEEGNT